VIQLRPHHQRRRVDHRAGQSEFALELLGLVDEALRLM